jgi:hypothetical protein
MHGVSNCSTVLSPEMFYFDVLIFAMLRKPYKSQS